MRGSPSQVKGDGFRVRSRRGSQVRILLHALQSGNFCKGLIILSKKSKISNRAYSWIMVSIILNFCTARSAWGLFAGMMIISPAVR